MNSKTTLRWKIRQRPGAGTMAEAYATFFGSVLPEYILVNMEGMILGEVVKTIPRTKASPRIHWDAHINGISVNGTTGTIETAMKIVEALFIERGYTMLPEKFTHFE